MSDQMSVAISTVLHAYQILENRGLISTDDRLIRIEGEGRDFFSHHSVGSIMAEEVDLVKELIGTTAQLTFGLEGGSTSI